MNNLIQTIYPAYSVWIIQIKHWGYATIIPANEHFLNTFSVLLNYALKLG